MGAAAGMEAYCPPVPALPRPAHPGYSQPYYERDLYFIETKTSFPIFMTFGSWFALTYRCLILNVYTQLIVLIWPRISLRGTKKLEWVIFTIKAMLMKKAVSLRLSGSEVEECRVAWALARALGSQQAAEGLEPQDGPKRGSVGHPCFPWVSPTLALETECWTRS